MIDRKIVIENLEQNIRWIEGAECHQFPGWGNATVAMRDAAELLKEQEYAQCRNCQFRDFGGNDIDSWDRCKLHRHNTSPDEYCSWFVEKAVKWDV